MENRICFIAGARSQYSQLYRAVPQELNIIQDMVNDMLEKEMIEPSKSAWATLVVLVPKPDESYTYALTSDALTLLQSRITIPCDEWKTASTA